MTRHAEVRLPEVGAEVRIQNPNSANHGRIGTVTAILHPEVPWLTAVHITYTEGPDEGWTGSHLVSELVTP
jgi:hypothetical protein